MVETEDNDNALARVCACNASGQILMDRQGGIEVVKNRCASVWGDFTLWQDASLSPFCLTHVSGVSSPLGWTKSRIPSDMISNSPISHGVVLKHKQYVMSLGPSVFGNQVGET